MIGEIPLGHFVRQRRATLPLAFSGARCNESPRRRKSGAYRPASRVTSMRLFRARKRGVPLSGSFPPTLLCPCSLVPYPLALNGGCTSRRKREGSLVHLPSSSARCQPLPAATDRTEGRRTSARYVGTASDPEATVIDATSREHGTRV